MRESDLTDFIHTPPDNTAALDSIPRVLFMHGAGAPADSDWMNRVAHTLANASLDVYRGEFDYMARRREDGKKRPPPKADRLLHELEALIRALPDPERPLMLAGKSMGGRVATLLASRSEWPQDLPRPTRVVVFGYPFYAPGKSDRPRIDHLPDALCPIQIVQGTRDPMGSRDQVQHFDLGGEVDIHWIEDGNHDLRPRGLKKDQVLPHLASSVSSIIQP